LASDFEVVTPSVVFFTAVESETNSSRLIKLYLVLRALSAVCIFLLTSFYTGSKNEKAKAAAAVLFSSKSYSMTPLSSSHFASSLIASFAGSEFLAVIAKASACGLSFVLSA